MEDVLAAGKIVFLTLLAFQIVLLVPRFISSRNKKECILFVAVLIVLGIKTFFSQVYVVGLSSSLILIYVTGNLLYSIAGEKYDFLWNICIGSVSAIVIVVIILRLTDKIYFPLFYSVTMIIAFVYPFVVIVKLYKLFHAPVLLYLIVAATGLILARGWDLVSDMAGFPFYDMTLWASIALTLGLGYLAFHEGYIIGMHPGGEGTATTNLKRTDSVFSRLVHTENTLLLQDRIIASGILAIGAIHEFKNIITNIKAVCQFGLYSKSEEKKQQSLDAALENAEEAREVVRKYLDTVALEIDEKQVSLDMHNDLRPLFQILSTHFHRQRISFVTEIEEGIRLFIGRGEIEQVILNLVRNSSDSFNAITDGEKTIGITAKRSGDHAVIDFSDTGPGVPEAAESKVLHSRFSGKGSSGLGLMLVKLIVMRNKGQIEYHPSQTGARFRIILPCETDATDIAQQDET